MFVLALVHNLRNIEMASPTVVQCFNEAQRGIHSHPRLLEQMRQVSIHEH